MYLYNEDFYDSCEKSSIEIAGIMLPYVMEWIKPRSIVDFGCGEGIWLNSARDIDDTIEILGIDGNYINRKRLKIPENNFMPANLEERISLEHKYDLAISLEVAEHLNEKTSDLFVESITQASDNILFSAAIPGQGGVNHINEQWQDYWIKKFVAKKYLVDTSLRNFFWKDKRISPWRKQNILFFSKNTNRLFPTCEEIYNIVHPDMFMFRIKNPIAKRMMGTKEIYCRIDEKICELLKMGYKNFLIYPFGQNGFLCKEILNNKYQIKELAIVDNKLEQVDSRILKAWQIKDIKDEYCVIENCSNYEVHQEILDEIMKYVDEDRIFSVFEELNMIEQGVKDE